MAENFVNQPAEMLPIALMAKGLVKKYPGSEYRALDGVDLKIAKGSIFGLLGPNGAGKTTSIKSILGMCEPQSGQISVLRIS